MKTTKKIIAIVLSVMLLLSVMPMAVFAANIIEVANQNELTTAIANAQNGDTIKFTASNSAYPATSGAKVYDINGKDITIDLNGQTQYFRVSGETAVVYETALFLIHNGGKLTMKDSVGTGAFYATYSANSPAYMFISKAGSAYSTDSTKNDTVKGADLVIESGKYVMDKANYGSVTMYQNFAEATITINGGEFVTDTGAKNRRDYIINNSRGDVEINGGTFTTKKNTDYAVYEGNTTETSLTINDGVFNGGLSLDVTKADTELNGGTYLTVEGNANTAVSKYLPADEVIDSTTGQIKDVDANTVARIDSAEYTSLADAVAACTNTSSTTTITMVKDTTEAAPITISNGAKITINANGCKVTCTDRVFIIRHGQLTFNNGTINSTTDDGVAVYGAATDQGSNYSTFTLGTNAVINAPNYFGAMIGNNNGGAYGAKITISSTAVVNSKYGIYINGSVAEPETKTNAAAISITGTINGDNAEPAIYAAGYAKWTIGGTSYTANITAGSGIYIKSGDMTITNANITAVGQKADYVFNANGADGTGDAIIIDSCGYPGSVPTVTIKGGTITSANGAAVASYTKQDDPLYPTAEFPRVDEVIPATSTAVFSSDVSDLAAEGYVTVYDEAKGGYVVEELKNAANLTLKGTIEENIYMDADAYGLGDDAVIKVTANASSNVSETPDVKTTTYKVKDLTPFVDPEGTYTGTYKFAFKNAPAQITEEVTVALYADENAQEPVESITYSVKDYCDNVIAESNDAELVALCKSILDYGAAAQTAFGYNTDNMAVDEFYNANAIANLDSSDIENPVFNGSGIKAGSFACFATTDINLYVAYHYIEADGEVEVVGADDSEVKAVTKTRELSKFINISGIEAGNLLKTVIVSTSAGDIEINSQFLVKTILAYSNNATEVTLAKTIYFYAQAADAYFN